MKRNSKLIGMVVGLTTLLSGCDDNTTRVVEVCNNGPLQVQAVYHEVSMGLDYLTVDIYGDGKLVGSINTGDDHGSIKGRNTWINCGDSNVYIGNSVFGPGEFYRNPSNQKQ